jgi:hypothetical protein
MQVKDHRILFISIAFRTLAAKRQMPGGCIGIIAYMECTPDGAWQISMGNWILQPDVEK